jgi:hypothetical protein
MKEMGSLSQELRIPTSPVTQWFRSRLPNYALASKAFREQVRGAETILPPESDTKFPYPAVGQAIDYRLRYYFGETPVQKLVAVKGMNRLIETLQVWSRSGAVPAKFSAWKGFDAFFATTTSEASNVHSGIVIPALGLEFLGGLQQVLRDAPPVGQRLPIAEEESLCRHCFILALFDEIARAPWSRGDSPLFSLRPRAGLDDLLAVAQAPWVEDIRAMSHLFYDRHPYLLDLPAVLNPVFGRSDVALSGADADIILDGCLIDFKATINPKFERDWLYQILGYAFLDFEDSYRIHSVGLYMARQGALVQWPLATLLPELAGAPVTLDALRQEFRAKVAVTT